MSVDVSTLALEVQSNDVVTASGRLDGLSAAGKRAESATNSLSSSTSQLAGYLKAAAAAFASWKLTQYIEESTKLAARVETLSVVMRVVGNNAGYTGSQMDAYTASLKKQGITTQESMASLIKMAGAQMDLSKASQLARVAQDAAVIGNINSSEAFGRLIQGIRSGETEILKTIGLNVQFEQGYKQTADTLGKTTEELTNVEKTASRMNQVLQFGTNIAGAYDSAMGTAGKQVNSMARFTEELKLAFGQLGLPTFTVLIGELTQALKEMNDQAQSNKGGFESLGTSIADFTRGTLAYFKKDLSDISALWTDIRSGIYLLRSFMEQDKSAALRATSQALAEQAEAIRDYKRAVQAADNGQSALDPSDQKNLFMAKSAKEDATLAASNAARRAQEQAAARKAAADAAADAKEQSERQARYNQQLADAESDLTKLKVSVQRQADDSILKNRLTSLQLQNEQGLISAQQFVDQRFALEKAALEKELKAAQAIEAARKTDADKMGPGSGADRILQIKAQSEYQKALSDTAKVQGQLNQLEAEKPAEDWAVQVAEVQRLTAAITEYYNATVQNYDLRKRMTQEQATADAALTGRNTRGEFDSASAETQNQLAVQSAAHQIRLQQIEDEKQSVLNALMEQKISYEDYGKTVAEIEKKKTLASVENSQKTTLIQANGFKAQLAVASTYADLAGGLMASLASTQDQSSRSGFESAKALNLGAAIVSTAAAVMNQMSGGDPYTAWARAAAAGAMGAIQIATIMKTTFGGGASAPSVSGGTFAAGGSGAGNSGVGAKIGSQVQTPAQLASEESLRSLAAASENASLALGRVADGLTSIADLFQTGYAKNTGKGLATPGMAQSSTAWGDFTASPQNILSNVSFSASSAISGLIKTYTDPYKIGFKALFGGGWKSTGAGLSLGLEDGEFTGQNYVDRKKSGGLLGSSKRKTNYSNLDAGLEGVLSGYLDQIKSTISTSAAVLGTTTDFESVQLKATKIKTSGRKPEDIQKDLEALYQSMADTLAKSTDGLKDFTFYGENAFDAMVRLSTSLQGVNEKLELTGNTLIESSLKGADAAYRLADAFGGLDKFADSVDKYFSVMFTDAQQDAMKAAQATRQVNAAFKVMNVSVPQTREDFIALVDSLNLSTDAGLGMYKALMDIAPAFATMTEQVAKLQGASVDFALSAAKTIQDILNSNLSTGSPESNYLSKKAAFDAAMASGNTKDLDSIAKSFLEASRAYNASGEAYSTDFAKVMGYLSNVAGMTDSNPTLTAANKQVDLLQSIKDILSGDAPGSVAALAAQLNAGSAVSQSLASYAVGTNYVPRNMTADIHQGEMILDRQSADVLRNYGIPQPVAADGYGNDELIAELRALRQEVADMKQQTVGKLTSIETKARLVANS